MAADARRLLVVDESAVFAECLATGLRLVGNHDVAVLSDTLTVEAVLANVEASPRDAVVMDGDFGPGLDAEVVDAVGTRRPGCVRDDGVD